MSEHAVLVLEIGNEREHFEAAFPSCLCTGWIPAPAKTRCCWSRARLAFFRSPMITLQNVTLRRGAKVLLNGVNATINPGEKAGLVGRNGAGKSSLFALLNGSLHEDGGDFYMPTQWRMAQVAQNMPETDESATDFVLAATRA
jgi:ABC-type multidrug transport system fused ATPase/permease subunit